MAERFYVATSAARPLLAVAVESGLDREELLSILDASEDGLRDPDARAPVERYAALWEHVDRALDDPSLSVRVAAATSAESYHLLGFAVMTSADCREMINRFIRYTRLHTNVDVWSLDEVGDLAVVRLDRRYTPLARGSALTTECVFAKCTHIFRRTTNQLLRLRSVRFRHARPRDTRPLERFFGVSPEFDAGEDAFAFDLQFLSAPLASANPALGDFIVSEAESRLAVEPTNQTLAQRVRSGIGRALFSGEPAMTDMARRLGMSERTLRRQLNLERVTFRGLVDDVRREKAAALIRGNARVSEIAFMLGFAELSAFGRAFRRWFGVSPRVARAGGRLDLPPGSGAATSAAAKKRITTSGAAPATKRPS
jgi:AraC-like DNA-binding protein